MSEEVKNEENNSEKKWLWLLLLLLLFIFVVVGIVVFLKDNGTAEAIDNDYNEVKQEQVVKSDEPKEETGISSNEETKKLVNSAKKQLITTSMPAEVGGGTPAKKAPIVVNVPNNSYFNEPVVLEIVGNDYVATITDSNGNTSKYEGNVTISEDGKYTLTIKESDGTETTITFVIDTQSPVITGVEEGKYYNSGVTPSVEEPNLDKVTLTKDDNVVEYSLGATITEEGSYTLTVEDKAKNITTVSFKIDITVPVLTVKEDSVKSGSVYGKISFKLFDNNMIDKVEVNGTTIDMTDNQWGDANYDAIKALLKEGENTIVLYDVAGNFVENKFTMDLTAPTLTVKEDSVGTDPYYSKISFKLFDNYKIDKIEVNGITIDMTDNQWGDANYDAIKPLLTEGENTIVLYDAVGNKTERKFTMDWTKPTVTVEYSTTELTNKKVTVKLNANEDVMVLNGETWNPISEYAKLFKKAYKDNVTETITVTDKAGNTNTVEVKIENIDKVAPTLTVKEDSVGTDSYYSKVSFKLFDSNKIDKIEINGTTMDMTDNQWGDANYDAIKPLLVEGENKIVLYDVAGNKTNYKFTMDWTKPTATVEYSTTELTNKDVTAKINANEKVMISNGTTWNPASGYKKIFKKSYEANTTETITIIDQAGNENTVEVKVENIDKVAPTLTVKEDSVGTGTTYSRISFKLSDNRLFDKLEINGTTMDVSNAQWGDANYDAIRSLLVEGKNTVILYDVAGNKTKFKFTFAPPAMLTAAKAPAKQSISNENPNEGQVVVDENKETEQIEKKTPQEQPTAIEELTKQEVAPQEQPTVVEELTKQEVVPQEQPATVEETVPQEVASQEAIVEEEKTENAVSE